MEDLGLICLIALDELVDILPGPLATAFELTAPRSLLQIENAEACDCEQAFTMNVDGHVFACATYDGPLPEEEYEFAERKSLFWQDAGMQMSSHRAFVALCAAEPETGHGLVRAQAVALTRLAAAICEVLPVQGLYWRSADTLSAPQAIARAAAAIDKGKWPVDIWIGWQMYGDDNDDQPVLGLHTRGAAEFLGFELDIPPFPVIDKIEPLRILYGAAGYLLARGDVIREGQFVEVVGERRTDFKILPATAGRPRTAQLTVVEDQPEKIPSRA